MQDLSVRMSASGSCRTSCARSLSTDLLCKISRHALDTHDLRRGLHFETKKSNFTCIPRTRHARSPQRVALGNQKTQFHLHSAHLTRTISAEGCTSKPKKAISLAFRALDTHDLRRGLHLEIKKNNFTCIPCTRHARSPQRAHISKPCFRSTAPATKS